MKEKHTNPAPTLEWRESRTRKRCDELHLGDDGQTIAEMQWKGMFSTFATGHARTGQWTFERPRLFSREIEVYDTQTGTVSIFSPGWTREGVLTLDDGRRFHWQSTNFWGTRWVFVDAEGQPLAQFVDTSGFIRNRAAVGISAAALAEKDRALLLLLGWYLITLQRRDAAAIAATTASTAAAV